MPDQMIEHSNCNRPDRLLQGTTVTRRVFLGGRIYQWLERIASSRFLARTILPAILSVSGLVVWSWIRFLWPNQKRTVAGWHRLSRVYDLSPDSVDGRWVISHGVWIVRRTDQGRDRILVLRAACTHLGCTTQWDPSSRQFICPCHGSAFSLDGSRLRGPATRAMDRCAVRVTSEGFVEIQPDPLFQGNQGEIEYS